MSVGLPRSSVTQPSKQLCPAHVASRKQAFNKHSRDSFLLSADTLARNADHIPATKANIAGKMLKTIVETNWDNTTSLFRELSSTGKATVVFNTTIIDGSFWDPDPAYGDVVCVSNLVFTAAGNCEQIFCALMQILFATRSRKAGQVAPDCTILTKENNKDYTNISLKFKFDDKWIYAGVVEQPGLSDGMIVIGTDY